MGFNEVNYVAAFKEHEYALDLTKYTSAVDRQSAALQALNGMCGVSTIVWSERKVSDLTTDLIEETKFSMK